MKNVNTFKKNLITFGVASLITAAVIMTSTASMSFAATTLEAQIESGLPVPTQNISKSMEQTPFLATSMVVVKADINDVTEFYRTELAKLKWQEDKTHANMSATGGELNFVNPEGTARLLLATTEEGTQATLSTRSVEGAKKSGLMATEGNTKIILGNFADGDAVISIDNQSIKIAAHAGEMEPDGPSLELKPGSYSYKFTTPGEKAVTAELVVGENQIWSLMVAPGGALPIQLY